jgi:hypothetical protein
VTPWGGRSSGTVRIAAVGAEAFQLFTPEGERTWAVGWDPHVIEAGEDDSAPGTVFETSHGRGPAVWVVTGRETGRSISYARVVEGHHAGTVGVTLDAASDGCGSVATVTYDVTALTDAAAHELADFAEHFSAFMAEWESAIAAAARGG